MRRRRRPWFGDFLQRRRRTGRFVHSGEEAVAHDRVQPGAQIGPRLPEMRIRERLHQSILNEVVGVRLVAVPAAHRAPQERDLVLDLPKVFGRRTTALALRPIGAAPDGGIQQIGVSDIGGFDAAPARRASLGGVYASKVGSLGMCLHFLQVPHQNREKYPDFAAPRGFTQVNVGL